MVMTARAIEPVWAKLRERETGREREMEGEREREREGEKGREREKKRVVHGRSLFTARLSITFPRLLSFHSVNNYPELPLCLQRATPGVNTRYQNGGVLHLVHTSTKTVIQYSLNKLSKCSLPVTYSKLGVPRYGKMIRGIERKTPSSSRLGMLFQYLESPPQQIVISEPFFVEDARLAENAGISQRASVYVLLQKGRGNEKGRF